jgi:hypothetical protein
MARTGRDGPTDRAWPAAVVLGLALVAGAYGLALVWPMVVGPCPCRDPDGRLALVVATSRDLWVAVSAARYVASGALGFVYESSPALTALPLYSILLAPLVAAGDALGLSGPPAPAASLYLLLVRSRWGWPCPCCTRSGGCSATPATGARPRPPRSGRRCWWWWWCPSWWCTGTGRRTPWPCSPWSWPCGWPAAHRLGLGRLEHRVVLQLAQASVDPHGRLGPGGQVQVGGDQLEHLLELLGDPDPALGSPVPQPHPSRVGPAQQSLGLHAPLLRARLAASVLPIRSERPAGGLNSGLVRCRGANRADSPPGRG